MSRAVYVIGAGGHAKAVLAALEANDIYPLALYDDDASRWGGSLFNIPVKGGLEDFVQLGAVTAVIAIGDNAKRQQIAERFTSVDWLTVVHPYSCIHSSVVVGEGTVILEGTIAQPDVTIGRHCIINVQSMIAHDCTLEDYVHISGAKLTGNVHLCEGVLLGGNTTVHPGIKVGAWSKSAIATAIMRDVLPASIVIGNPGRAIKA
jgi:sugar O-acyltransferase (sialic acid O-acetyltransferase NeuD family)